MRQVLKDGCNKVKRMFYKLILTLVVAEKTSKRFLQTIETRQQKLVRRQYTKNHYLLTLFNYRMDYSCILHLSYHAQMENAEKKLNLNVI